MYLSVEDIRSEGVTTTQATDERVHGALVTATAMIDKLCGWFFEPRDMGFSVSGQGTPVVELPVPPIRLTQIRIGARDLSPEHFHVIGAPIPHPAFLTPKLICRNGYFPREADNVYAFGRWGYTVPSPNHPDGATPPEIRRAALLLVRRLLPLVGSDEAAACNDWRLVEERTRDQSYRMQPREDGPLTGDPEVDSILLRYRRPMALGAA